MKIGMMNNPYEFPHKEVEWAGKKGFDFIDFTIEPTLAIPEYINVPRIKKLMKKYDLGIVGHTGDWRMPKFSDFISIRRMCAKELLEALKVLHRLGAKTMTLHASSLEKKFNLKSACDKHSELLRTLIKQADRYGMKILIENTTNTKDRMIFIETMLKRHPKLGLHIDVGHTNLLTRKNMLLYFLKKYRNRLYHVHFSDNHGKDDDHIALGKGNINWPKVIKLLKKYKYDGTITLEVIWPNRNALLKSKKTLERLWKRLK